MATPTPSFGRMIQGLAALGLVASVGAMGLFGLPAPGGIPGMLMSLAAAALLIAALLGLRVLAQERGYALPDFQAGLLRAAVGGMVFIAVIYHLAWLSRFFNIIHVAIDRLMPVWAEHILGLAPGILIILAVEHVLRQPAHPHRGGPLKPTARRQRTGRN